MPEPRQTVVERLTAVEEGLRFTRDDVQALKSTVSRVGWIVVTAVLVALLAMVIKAP